MTLHDYQKRCADFIAAHTNCILSVDMGLGKTAAVLEYIRRSNPSTVLIVAPKRVAENNWHTEALKWGLDEIYAKMIVCAGTAKKRGLALKDAAHPYKIISRDNIKDCKGLSFDLLVIDELTSFKSIDAARTKAVMSIKAKRKAGLTGTFLANGAIDIYGQAASVGLSFNNYNFFAWRATYFRDALAGSGLAFHKWKLNVPLEAVLKPIQDNIFTLTAADYLHIPAVSYETRQIELTESERTRYENADAFLQLNIGDEILSVNERAKFAKLQTLCNGFVYLEDGSAVRSDYCTKLEAVADFVLDCKEAGEPVLLFYSYREEALWLHELLTERGVKCESVKKAGFLERWNAGQTECLFAHPASAGHGLNMQAGGRICVWSSVTWNYELWAQGNARLARQGQTRQVRVVSFVAKDTCEAGIVSALARKDKEQNQFLTLTKKMKTNKINPDDVAKLIGYTKYTVYKLTLKSDEYIMLWLKKHKTPRAKYVFGLIKAYQEQVRKRKVFDKNPLERNINDLVRENKQNELFIINEKISRLEEDMKAVIFDREINSQLQALYIKRKCLHQFLGIKDDTYIE